MCYKEHPLSSVSGRQRYNTLDFAGKIVCQQGASRPYWKPRAKGILPFGYPNVFGESGDPKLYSFEKSTFPENAKIPQTSSDNEMNSEGFFNAALMERW